MEVMSVGAPRPIKRRTAGGNTPLIGVILGVIVVALLVAFTLLPGDSGNATQAPTTSAAPASPPTAPAPPQKDESDLTLNFIGDCTSEGGSVAAITNGFTPGGEYVIEMKRKGDQWPVAGFDNIGVADRFGSTPHQQFDCTKFIAGEYDVWFTDLTSQESASNHFRVRWPSS